MAQSKAILLTQEGLVKFKEELEYLKNEKRIEIAEKLKEAISYGDLSENSEYQDARDEQAQIETKIAEMTEQLKNVEIIKDDKQHKKINIGSIVTLKSLKDGEKEEYQIVGSTESDILAKPAKISNESPIGEAIIGKKKGDKVKFKSPAGKMEFEVIKI